MHVGKNEVEIDVMEELMGFIIPLEIFIEI